MISFIILNVFMRPERKFAMMACISIHLILFIFIFPLCSLAQNDGTVGIGSILIANESSRPWLSPSGEFAFGFQYLQEKDQFLLSIYYDKIPDKTIAWFVDSSVNPVSRGSTVELDAQTGLVLRDPHGQLLWSPGIVDEIHHGFMNDSGNFILMASNFTWLWQSFFFATDTILPLQQLVYGSVLHSRQSQTNFSRGRFYLRFLDDGNLVLRLSNMGNDTDYYNSQTSDPSNSSNSANRIIFDSSGSLNILKRNNQTIQFGAISIPPASENYHRATLDFDGIFTHYFHPKNFSGKPGWTILWAVPENICTELDAAQGSGVCGYNSICSIVDRKPVCECPKGYKLLDPTDENGSCKPNFNQSCDDIGKISEEFDTFVVTDIVWPKSDYEEISPSTEDGCKQACLKDCLCAVAVLRNNSCWKKKLPLSNGRIDTNLSSKTFLKYSKSEAHLQCTKVKDQETLIILLSVLLGCSLVVNILFISRTCLGFHFIYQKKTLKFLPNHGTTETNLHCFSFKELAEATNGFKEELGRGSFGIVYRGETQLSSGDVRVAVKKLDRVAQDAEKEFRAEVSTIGQTNHKNLVRLLGFCDEGKNRLLVYEYMSNGTLASILFHKPKPSWKLRTEMAIGIARGLVYLHEECSSQIIHCDIKPQNILLDDDYNARIADFGLAKLLLINQSRTLTNIRGTKGYVAPEWFRNTQITSKVDVYSFGVVLLEIIACRRNLEDVQIGEGGNAILTDWAWDCFQEGRVDTLVENDLEAFEDRMKLERFVKVGIWCIQEDSALRPTMRKVSHMLEGIVEVMVPPCPFLC